MDDKNKDPLSKLITAGRLANPLREALKPLVGLQLPKVVNGLSIQMPTFSTGIERVLTAHNERMNGILSAFQQPAPWLGELLEKIERGTALFKANLPIFGEHLGSLLKAWEHLPARNRASILAMAEAGWYVDLEMGMSDVLDFKQILEEEGNAKADSNMMAHFEERLDVIQASLIADFPYRRPFFDAAFDAVRRGEHILAIPVLLTQTDGICKDVAGRYFFITERGKGAVPERPGIAAYVLEQVHSDLSEAFLCMFEEVRPIGLSEKRRAPDFKGLNRHTVLHGEDLDYGTKVNCLKAVSLLNYVAQILTRKLQDDDVPEAIESKGQ